MHRTAAILALSLTLVCGDDPDQQRHAEELSGNATAGHAGSGSGSADAHAGSGSGSGGTHAGSGSGHDCGMCNMVACPLEQYSKDKLSWFEENCPEHIDRQTRICVDALDSHHANHEHESTIDHSHAETPWNILVIFGSFALGALVRFLTMGSRVPYTVLLFVLGMIAGFVSEVDSLNLKKYAEISEMDPHLIFHIFLPVLIFESAFAMDIPTFRKVIWQCLILAVPGIMVAAFLTGMVAKYAFTEYGWDWYASLLFGTILSATDPVAVVALLKDLGASPIISTMIEGESLFNDGTAIVFYTVLVGAIQKSSCTPIYETCEGGENGACWCGYECELDKSILGVVGEFCKVSFGGAAVGLVVGIVTVFSLNKVFNDALIEITLTLVAAYVTFFVAEGFLHVSGVIGVVTCGCYMSYFKTCISPEVEHTLHHFWEMTVYLTNTMIFILAGLITALKAFNTVEYIDILYLAITYGTINVVRLCVLLFFMPLLCCFQYKLTTGTTLLVAWGGLRGAVGLALSLMVQADEQVVFETMRTKLIFHVAGICVLTLCVNGVSTRNLVRCFKLDAVEDRRRKNMNKRWKGLLHEQHLEITDLRGEPLYYDTNWEQLGRFTDLGTTLPSGMEDPYNEKGWADKNSCSVDENKQLTCEEDATVAYLNTCSASVHAQAAFGTLTRGGVRSIHGQITEQKEMLLKGEPGQNGHLFLMPSSPIPAGFDTNLKMKLMGGIGMSERALRSRWLHGFDMALGFIQCHKLARDRISSLCDASTGARVETHCKRVITEAVDFLDQEAKKRPDISCSVKTRQASRHVLNAMRQDIGTMKHRGHLDTQDATLLLSQVNQSMKRLRRMPRSMESPTAVEAVEDAEWFKEAEPLCQGEIRSCAVTNLVQLKPQEPLAERLASPRAGGRAGPREASLPGLYHIVTGIVQLRVGRKMCHYGAGYTIGWQQALTTSTRFSDAITVTDCQLVLLPHSVIRPLLAKFQQFCQSAWRCCGVCSARILMGIPENHGRFDPKIWDERRVRQEANRGQIEYLQDPDAFEADHQRKHKIREGARVFLLRGRAWEYGDEDDHIGTSNLCRFPTLLPAGWKFGTFTGHSVLFIIDEESTAATRSRRRWGRLRSKVRSIFIWSNLRGRVWGRVALARAFGRPDPSADPKSPWYKSSGQLAPEEEKRTDMLGDNFNNATPAPQKPDPPMPPPQPRSAPAPPPAPARQPPAPAPAPAPARALPPAPAPAPVRAPPAPAVSLAPTQPPPARVQQRSAPALSNGSDSSSDVSPPPTPPGQPLVASTSPRHSAQPPMLTAAQPRPIRTVHLGQSHAPAYSSPLPSEHPASPSAPPGGSPRASAAHRARAAPSPKSGPHLPPPPSPYAGPEYSESAYPPPRADSSWLPSVTAGRGSTLSGPGPRSPLSRFSSGPDIQGSPVVAPLSGLGQHGTPGAISSSLSSEQGPPSGVVASLPAPPDFQQILSEVEHGGAGRYDASQYGSAPQPAQSGRGKVVSL